MLIADLAGLSLTEAEKHWLTHPCLSGIILFARNVESPKQVAQLCADIRACNPKLLISVDQEGGRVMRLKRGFVSLPPLATLGEWHKHAPEEARTHAFNHGWLMAHDVLSVGIDLSFAPVLDVNHQLSEVIGDRAFASSPEVIIDLATHYMQGMQQAGMRAVGKHFPGHGGVTADTHTDTAVDTRAARALFAEDAHVFEQLARTKLLAAIMTAHVCYPAVDSQVVTFSSTWLTDILRHKWGYKGIIFSDDLTMHAAVAGGEITQRAQMALDAGCDYLLVCNNNQEALTVLAFLETQCMHRCQALARTTAYMKSNWQTYTSREQMHACTTWQARVANIAQLAADNL